MSQVLSPGMVLRVTIVTLLNNQVAENNLHWKVQSISGSPTDQQLADIVDTNVAPTVKACMGANTSYRGTLAQIIFPLPIYRRVGQNASAGAGTGSGNALPGQASGIITWESIFAGPAARGRMFVPFPASGFLSSTEFPTNGYVTALTAVGNAITAIVNIGSGGNTAVMSFCLYNFRTHVTTPITTFIPRQAWATQKKRGDYGKTFSAPI